MGGLARDLIYKVQLYASILSKSLYGASVQSGAVETQYTTRHNQT